MSGWWLYWRVMENHKINQTMQLTRAEEQIMLILWELGEGVVRDIRERFDEPKPARNTITTVLKVLERKGYVDHKAYANVFLYYPLISKREYSKHQLFGLLNDYFNNSFPALTSFFAREKNLSLSDLDRILQQARRELDNDQEE